MKTMAGKSVKVFNGRLLKVYKLNQKLPNGNISYFEKVEHPGAALVVPFLGDKVIFIRQYRAVIDKYIWELPAGKLDPAETPYCCAKREVREETGYLIRGLKKIGFIYTTPGFCTEKIHIFKAVCYAREKAERDEDEMIRVRCLSVPEIHKLFITGKINDSKTVAALGFAGILSQNL